MKKQVLVLLSAYQGERYLREQIESILRQKTECSVTLRIRDDGSRDATVNVIRAAMERYPGRIELVSGEHIGGNAGFFRLLDGAAGYDYYAISDQDDLWLPDKLETACAALEREDPNLPLLYASVSWLASGDALKRYGTTRPRRRPLHPYNTLIQNICPGHTQVMNNALLRLVQRETDVSRIYVYDAWIANLAMLYGKVLFDNRPHTLYRQHGGNQMGTGSGALGKLLRSAERAREGDGLRYREQIAYFAEVHRAELARQGLLGEVEAFLNSRTPWERLRYILRSRLYRQSAAETAAFRLAVLLGKF